MHSQEMLWLSLFWLALMMVVAALVICAVRNHFHRREKDLRDQLAQLNLLLENMSDIPGILNLRTLKWEYISPAIEKLTGYTQEEFLNQSVAEILTPAIYPLVMDKLAQRIDSYHRNAGGSHTYTDWIEHTRKDGSTVLVEFISKYIRGERGDPLLVGVSRDISDRHKVEQKLRDNNEILESLLMNTPHLLSFTDREGRYLMVSKAMADTFGFTSEEIKGKHLDQAMPASAAARYMKHINTIVERREPLHSLEWVRTNEGCRAFDILGFPLIKRGDQVEFIGSIGMEVTAGLQAEEKVRQQNLEILALTNNVSDIIARFDTNLRYVYTNQKDKAERLMGKTNRELGMPEPNVTIWEGALRAAFGNKAEQTVETSNFGPRGMRYYHSVVTPEPDDRGEVTSVVTVTRDISNIKELQVALDLEKQNLYTTLESIGEGVISTDSKGNIVLINKVAQGLTGWGEEAKGQPFGEVYHIIDEITGEPCPSPVRRVLNGGQTTEPGAHTVLISKPGGKTPIEDTSSPIIDEAGRVMGVVVVFRDITERREKQEKIIYLSYHDQLTGLYNRRFFMEEISRLDTSRNLPITLIVADVNGLKLTNDAFGHRVGDELLLKAAQVIKAGCRTDDIIARVGGDEFCVLLPKTSAEQAEGIIKRIRKAMAAERAGGTVLSVSFGWESKREPGEQMDAVFKKAEDRMYRFKLSESSNMRIQTLKLIVQTLNAKHPREERHSQRVSQICAEIGQLLGLDPARVRDLQSAGLMHDIGKIIIDENILNKQGMLTEVERQEVNRHAETGYRILSSVSEFVHIAEFVLAHHERWDGSGYPKGLKGEAIPLEARIIAVADAYDAMTTAQPYNPALGPEDAVLELKRNAGLQFDPAIVAVFIDKVLGVRD